MMAPDTVDTIADIPAASPLGQLRRQRADIFLHTQGSHDVLLTPADPGGVSLAERAAIALLMAEYDDDAALAAHYRQLLDSAGGMPQGERWDALLVHADLLAGTPGEATAAHLRRLEAVGLSSRDIVAVSQLIAFVSYQLRLIAGLRLLQQPASGQPAAVKSDMPHISPGHFTQAQVEWLPWIEPVSADTATAEQRAALEASPSSNSPYFRTLAHDVASLAERSPLFHSVMYVPRGLPRAERELATAVTSMVNGCVYCCSVHARRFSELTKKPEIPEALFAAGLAAPVEPRLRAVIDYAVKLTATPSDMAAADLAPLRDIGLSDMDLLDLTHAVAMFANANRLMQTLGEPILP